MIESKQALVERFLRLAGEFEKSQNPVVGIDLDDATVALKRYVLTEEKNQTLASTLGRLGKLIRNRDMATFSLELEQIRQGL
jgi:hypothetical protein